MQLNPRQTIFLTGIANLAGAFRAMTKLGAPDQIAILQLGPPLTAVFESLSLEDITDLIERGFEAIHSPDFDSSELSEEARANITNPEQQAFVRENVAQLKELVVTLNERAEEASQEDHDASFGSFVEEIADDLKADGC